MMLSRYKLLLIWFVVGHLNKPVHAERDRHAEDIIQAEHSFEDQSSDDDDNDDDDDDRRVDVIQAEQHVSSNEGDRDDNDDDDDDDDDDDVSNDNRNFFFNEDHNGDLCDTITCETDEKCFLYRRLNTAHEDNPEIPVCVSSKNREILKTDNSHVHVKFTCPALTAETFRGKVEVENVPRCGSYRETECENDFHCSGLKICCPTGCWYKLCRNPLMSRYTP